MVMVVEKIKREQVSLDNHRDGYIIGVETWRTHPSWIRSCPGTGWSPGSTGIAWNLPIFPALGAWCRTDRPFCPPSGNSLGTLSMESKARRSRGRSLIIVLRKRDVADAAPSLTKEYWFRYGRRTSFNYSRRNGTAKDEDVAFAN